MQKRNGSTPVDYIRGIVKDSAGLQLPNASIFISDAQGVPTVRNGVQIGRTSDTQGNFLIPFTPKDEYVTFRYVAYQPLTLKTSDAKQRKEFSLEMKSLPQVVINGVKSKKTGWNTWAILGIIIAVLAAFFLIYKIKK